MSIKNNYSHTLFAGCIGYAVQSLAINFMPLLFVLFNTDYGISYDGISFFIVLNFFIQLTVDLISPIIIDRIGYRISAVVAHVSAAAGLILLSFLPFLLNDVYSGIIISLIFMSVGGGLIEVVVSPIVEACPHDNKNGYMCLLHSFFCWGHVIIVLASVAYFVSFGIENWRYLSLAFSLIPIFNIFYFLIVQINTLDEVSYKSTGEKGLTAFQLIRNKGFWLMLILMMCAGACELSVSQWASALAEEGLKVSKTVGDLAGPLSFAFLMGSSRVVYSLFGKRISIEKYMFFCCLLCFVSYLMITLSSSPVMSLVGCALCGWSVGVMWPGTYSIASKALRRGSTVMFGLLALAGDLGCIIGPFVVGFVSDMYNNNLKLGILVASVFSLLMLTCVAVCIRNKKRRS